MSYKYPLSSVSPRKHHALFLLLALLGIAETYARAAEDSPLESVHDPTQAATQLDVVDDLQCTLFASEPMLVNPSAIDVDHRGRVWVCETINYRRYKENRPKGDRILILEDTDGDGRADQRTVFYQGADLNSPHGICVIGVPGGRGTRAIISCGSRIVALLDDDGDDQAERQEVLFTGIEGVQHDHGIHAVMFGPDGRLYFNFGNHGARLLDKNGNPVRDRAGNLVINERKPYQEGMVFRSNFNGTDVETLGWNFRNPWMVTVDSFGTIWQSDNDDDGNRGTRINFVMEFGNYGYRNEINGGNWQEFRTGSHQEIPLRHWHLNDPGVVPNLLQTGGGSPTGITVYEGQLLPEKYRGQLLHCDPGHNVVRCYRVSPAGAGYQGDSLDIVSGTRNPWFRPIDVKVAPDGSLIVSDWYDSGVGGHGMGDSTRGRLFRITPAGSDKGYHSKPLNFSTSVGAAKALANPNLAARAMAWRRLAELGDEAEPALDAIWHSDKPRMRARALWLLGQGNGSKEYLQAAFEDDDPQIRILGLRLARLQQSELATTIYEHVHDPSPAVRREMLISLSQQRAEWDGALWAELAVQYEGSDRWYLEALGIAGRGRWDDVLAAWRLKVGDQWNNEVGRDIVWRSRGKETSQLLAQLILQLAPQGEDVDRYFRAFDFQSEPYKTEALTSLLQHNPPLPPETLVEALSRVPNFDIAASPQIKKTVHMYLSTNRGTGHYFWLLRQFQLNEYTGDLLKLAIEERGSEISRSALQVLMQFDAPQQLIATIEETDAKVAAEVLIDLGRLGDPKGNDLLQMLMLRSEVDLPLRIAAAVGLSKTGKGQLALLRAARKRRVSDELRFTVSNALCAASDPEIREQAAELLPLPVTVGKASLPPVSDLIKHRGDARKGISTFASVGTCAKCHKVQGKGHDIGPDLSEIGSKLSREAMYLAILDPSASISHNYEQYVVLLDSGIVESGLLVNDSDDSITLRNTEGVDRIIPRDDIESLEKSPLSLMPAGLQQNLTQQQLVDLVEYLLSLKKKL